MSAVQLSLALQPFEPPPPPGALRCLAEMHRVGALALRLDPSRLRGVDQHLLFAARVRYEQTKTLSRIQCELVKRLAGVGR
jgi:hypothetical protein